MSWCRTSTGRPLPPRVKCSLLPAMFVAVSFHVTLVGIQTPFGACFSARILTGSPACPIAHPCRKAAGRIPTSEAAQMESLAGKVAIVTGASRGIRAATAVALGEAGASVMLAARNTVQTDVNAQRINAAGGKAAAIACDVSDYAACQRLVFETTQRFGPPDVLINNAGVIEPIGVVGDTDPAQWPRSIEVNLIRAYYAIRAY